MRHRPWRYTDRLVATMADSALLDGVDVSVLARGKRSAGLHMSEVLHRLYPPPTNEIDAEQLAVYGLLGLAFEDRAELALHKLAKEADWPYLACRSGEVDWYGVKGSPDILLTPKPEYAESHTVRELSLKVKWRSSRGLPLGEDFDGFPAKWGYELAQCMAYAGPLGTRGSVLLVYFVCGNWKPPFPHVLGWELDFHEDEIAEVMNAVTTLATEIVLES